MIYENGGKPKEFWANFWSWFGGGGDELEADSMKVAVPPVDVLAIHIR